MKTITGNIIFNIFLVAPILFYSCKENEIYPVTPEIKNPNVFVIYNNSGVLDSAIMLSFDYTDGDGDIGIDPSVTTAPFNSDTLGPEGTNSNRYVSNVWIDYYQKINGEYVPPVVPFGTDTIRRDSRTGNLTPEGTHKAIRGKITIPVLTLPQSWPDRSDTVRLKVRLVDRALHVSNIIQTGEIVLHKQ